MLGDKQGNVVHLHEHDCSVQRRYQKWSSGSIYWFASNVVNDLCGAGVDLAKKIGYDNAGTVEFLLDQDTRWFSLK